LGGGERERTIRDEHNCALKEGEEMILIIEQTHAHKHACTDNDDDDDGGDKDSPGAPLQAPSAARATAVGQKQVLFYFSSSTR